MQITAIDHGDRIEVRVSARRALGREKRVRRGQHGKHGNRRSSQTATRQVRAEEWIQLALW